MAPETMLAAVYTGGGNLDVRELPVPELGPDDALVQISHCGICGTDLHLVLEEYARPDTILGHEWAGTVAGVGTAVRGWEHDTPVVTDPQPGCGECRACRHGRPSVCLRRPPPDYLAFSGAFCNYIKVPAARLLRIPEGLALRAAALTEPTAIALHAAHLADATPADRVLVTGAGSVGLLIVAVLASLDITDITVSEPAPERRARALDVGAAQVIEPADLPSVPIGRTVNAPFTLAFECSGRPDAGVAALDHLDYAGTLVFVGTGSAPVPINHNRMIVLELTAIGAYNYDADGFAPAMAALASGRLPVDLLIDPEDVSLDGLLAAMQRMASGQRAGKVLVRPEVS